MVIRREATPIYVNKFKSSACVPCADVALTKASCKQQFCEEIYSAHVGGKCAKYMARGVWECMIVNSEKLGISAFILNLYPLLP